MSKRVLIIPLAWLCVFLLVCPVMAANEADEDLEGFFTLLGEDGEEIFWTGLQLGVGDQVITADNKRYQVTAVNGYQAETRFVEEVRLMSEPEEAALAVAENQAAVYPVTLLDRPVGVYCTHSDESYVPTEGGASVRAGGGILHVAESFARGLKRAGVEAIFDNTLHAPHDTAAYDRSRRTAENLMQRQLGALFDIHRDTGPEEKYEAEVGGRKVAQVAIVIGRENPAMEANLEFARRLKAVADRLYPGLVRGILIARGRYNQDLTPRAVLLEVGTHNIDRASAERGAMLLAEAVPETLKSISGSAEADRGSWSAVGWIVLLSVLGLGGYLLLSTGGIKEAGAKLRRMFGREMASFFGPLEWTQKRFRRSREESPRRPDRDDED
jgi:stage II sporulation protein P